MLSTLHKAEILLSHSTLFYNISVKKITETAILVAFAIVIDVLFKLIPFLNMPQGGHVSIAMLAIIINGFRNGWKYGLAGGVLFATLN